MRSTAGPEATAQVPGTTSDPRLGMQPHRGTFSGRWRRGAEVRVQDVVVRCRVRGRHGDRDARGQLLEKPWCASRSQGVAPHCAVRRVGPIGECGSGTSALGRPGCQEQIGEVPAVRVRGSGIAGER